ncbi:MAG: hypothetical protein ACFFBZ_02365 [Promethearchaeota archaeon]
MAFDIFRVDWILVDSIIIILLILLLIGVRIFKVVNRWRSSLSNERLSRIVFKGSAIKTQSTNIIIKKFELTKHPNENKDVNSKPTIILFKSRNKRKLSSALAEGISSYGMDVINLTCKILKNPKNNNRVEFQKDIIKLINSLYAFFKQNRIKISTKYYLVNFIQTNLIYSPFINDINNNKLILINPKLNRFNKTQILEILNSGNLRSRICLVYSGKINRFLKKHSLKRFIVKITSNNTSDWKLFMFKKASNSFKYYETILLGTIINIVENK